MKDRQINFGSYSLFSTLKSAVLIIAFFIMLRMYFGEKDSRIEQETLIEAANSELQVWKNKDGENVAKIQVLETEKKETFLAFKSQDSTIQELQQLVKENRSYFRDHKGAAGIIRSETTIDTSGVTRVAKDSLKNPIYSSNIKSKWFDIKTIASIDTTKVQLKTFHSMSLVMGSESQGLFKRPKSFAVAKDANPNSNIKEMRIYNVKDDYKRFVVGPYVGYGATVIGSDVKLGWQAGIGITYKLKEF